MNAANLQLSADAMRQLGDYMLVERARPVALPLSPVQILEIRERLDRFLLVLQRNEQGGLFLRFLEDAP